MESNEIITLVSSICAALSALASVITCVLMYINSRPKIKLMISKEKGHSIFSYCEEKGLALIALSISNISTMPSAIEELYIEYNGEQYFSDNAYSNFDPAPFNLQVSTEGLETDANKQRIKFPYHVDVGSFIDGFTIFPNFPVIHNNCIKVTVYYKIAHEHRLHVIKNHKLIYSAHETKNREQKAA